jgi:hypothetical protein
MPLAKTLAAPPGYSLGDSSAIDPIETACGVIPVAVPALLLMNTSLDSSKIPIVAALALEGDNGTKPDDDIDADDDRG